MRLRHISVAVFCLFVCAAIVVGDTLKLKDGTVLEGKVIPQGDSYWIRLTTGESRMVPKNQVLTFTPDSAAKKPDEPAAPAKSTAAAPSSPGVGITSTSPAFAGVKSKADRVDAPVQGVQMWETFIASKPPAGDLEAANAELEKWNQLQKDHAERIKGKWVGGVERKRLVKQAKNMVSEGVKEIEDGQSTAGFKKIEDALNLYPQSFEANFYLGLQYLKRSSINPNARAFKVDELDKAVKILENAAKIAPKSSSTWSNLAIGYSFKNRHREAVETAYKAALMHESPETVQNLVAAFRSAPTAMQQQDWCKKIIEDSVLMAERHNIPLKGDDRAGFLYVPPAETDEIPGSDSPAGLAWSGSGFFVTTDGYIITNHHVACGDPKAPINPNIGFRVRLDDGTEKTAELIAVDDQSDIAIMKIKTDSPVPALKLATYLPDQGTDLLVLGYPATGEEEKTLQISPGTVKSVHEGDDHEVWMDSNTTHGNSGGPIVDASDHVIGILTAGRQSYNMVITLAVSAHQIKAFLDKVGEKAPKCVFEDVRSSAPSFNPEKLAKQARPCTVCIMAVRTG